MAKKTAEAAEPKKADRPDLIDEQDGPCPHCAAWDAAKFKEGADGDPEKHPGTNAAVRHCDECGKPVALYQVMQGQGFQAPKPHHFHVKGVGPSGVPGREAKLQELCWACYEKAFNDAYPDAKKKPKEPVKLAE